MASAWTDLPGGIRVRQSRAYRMNSLLMLHADHTLVVDPGVLPSELDELAQVVAAESPKRITLCFTHADWDHVLGRRWWPQARTLAHDAFAEQVARRAEQIRDEAQSLAETYGERWPTPFQPFVPDAPSSGLRFLKLDSWRVVLRDAPGHNPSQQTVHFPEARLLAAGDMLSDIEMPSLDSPPRVYRATLEALRPLFEGGAIETLVPGHGTIARGAKQAIERFRADLDYLNSMERAVEQAVRDGLSLEATQERLTAMDYAGKRSNEYPTEPFHRENVSLTFRDLVRVPAR